MLFMTVSLLIFTFLIIIIMSSMSAKRHCFKPRILTVSRDHSNYNSYWLFIFMLKIVKKNLGIAKKMS